MSAILTTNQTPGQRREKKWKKRLAPSPLRAGRIPSPQEPAKPAPALQRARDAGLSTMGLNPDTGEYVPSEPVEQAEQRLEELETQKPQDTSGQYDPALEELYEKLTQRPGFAYDPSSDPLYRNYRQSWIQQGQDAMRHTMTVAAGLTGGYGSSYSQTAGQEAYGEYLLGLSDLLPQLYDMALSRYNQETKALQQQYDTLRERQEWEYDQYQDQYDRWFDAWTDAWQQAQDARELDYDQYLALLSQWQEKNPDDPEDMDDPDSTDGSSSNGTSGSSGSSSNGSSGNSGSSGTSNQDTSGSDGLTDKQVRALSGKYFSLDTGAILGSQAMIRWMRRQGIRPDQYQIFYRALLDLGYRHTTPGKGGPDKDRAEYVH